jgi:hypothetical protein
MTQLMSRLTCLSMLIFCSGIPKFRLYALQSDTKTRGQSMWCERVSVNRRFV